jgi:hypothetical protein
MIFDKSTDFLSWYDLLIDLLFIQSATTKTNPCHLVVNVQINGHHCPKLNCRLNNLTKT